MKEGRENSEKKLENFVGPSIIKIISTDAVVGGQNTPYMQCNAKFVRNTRSVFFPIHQKTLLFFRVVHISCSFLIEIIRVTRAYKFIIHWN